MIKRISIVVAILGLAVLGSFLGGPRYAQETPAEVAVAPEKPVSESDLQLYIDVYKAMQSDHGLKLEDALVGRGIALDDFRSLERRIQSKSVFVEKVRTALLEHAKQQPVLALQQPSAHAPAATPSPH